MVNSVHMLLWSLFFHSLRIMYSSSLSIFHQLRQGFSVRLFLVFFGPVLVSSSLPAALTMSPDQRAESLLGGRFPFRRQHSEALLVHVTLTFHWKKN